MDPVPCSLFLMHTQVCVVEIVEYNAPFSTAMLLIQYNVAMVMADMTQGL